MEKQQLQIELGNGYKYTIDFDGGAVAGVHLNCPSNKRLALGDSVQGKYVKSLPVGGTRKAVKNVAVKDLVAFAQRQSMSDGEHVTEGWLMRTEPSSSNRVEVVYVDGNAARPMPDNLRIVLRSELDTPQPALPRVCFAQSGATICGAEATIGSYTCNNHKQHEASASSVHAIAQLCVFRSWLFSRQRSLQQQQQQQPHGPGAVCQAEEEAQCASCVAHKLAEVDVQIQAILGPGGRSRFKWAVDPMFALFEPRIRVDPPEQCPHAGCCLAFAGKGAASRLCMKPIWQHNGRERLICMNHIVANAACSKYWELEVAVKHHIINHARLVKNRELVEDGTCSPFVDSAKFHQLMGSQFQ